MKKILIFALFTINLSCLKDTFFVTPRNIKEAKERNAFIKEFNGDITEIFIENKTFFIKEVYLTYGIDSKTVNKLGLTLVFKTIDAKTQQFICPDDYTKFEIIVNKLKYSLGYQSQTLVSRIPIETTSFTLKYHDDKGIIRVINFKEKKEQNVFKATKNQVNRGVKYAQSVVKKDYNVIYRNCTQFVQAVLRKTYNMPLAVLITTKYPKINFEMEKVIYRNHYQGMINYKNPLFINQLRYLD